MFRILVFYLSEKDEDVCDVIDHHHTPLRPVVHRLSMQRNPEIPKNLIEITKSAIQRVFQQVFRY